MKYCKRCILPDTRPGLVIEDDGICSGCHQHDDKKNLTIDWDKRHAELLEIFKDAKARGCDYDALVPVSGGKDSTWQVMKCLEYGLKVLAVTWRTPGRNAIGQHNLDNLINLGVDHIDFSISPVIERNFMRKAFFETGSTAVPMHLALYTTPLRMATSMNVPLVIWGESPYMEYAKNTDGTRLDRLDHNWMRSHGILQGKLADDWVDGKTLTARDMTAYQMPDENLFVKKDIKSIFLGFYLPWDPETTRKAALETGFKEADKPKIGLYEFADIDCDHISVHHWFKWFKFGFTRLFDNLAQEIRNGRMTRDEAIQTLIDLGPQKPEDDIKSICEFMQISLNDFAAMEERYRNRELWKQVDGKWVLPGFIVPDYKWWEPVA